MPYNNYNYNYNNRQNGNQGRGGNYNNYQGRRPQNNQGPTKHEEAKSKARELFNELQFDASWITKEATKEMVVFADKMGKILCDEKLTTSKFRNVFGEIKRIQVSGYEEHKVSFILLKPKIAYAVGRDKENVGLLLFQFMFDACFDHVTNKETYQNFCNLVEAILAYHKSHGGK